MVRAAVESAIRHHLSPKGIHARIYSAPDAGNLERVRSMHGTSTILGIVYTCHYHVRRASPVPLLRLVSLLSNRDFGAVLAYWIMHLLACARLLHLHFLLRVCLPNIKYTGSKARDQDASPMKVLVARCKHRQQSSIIQLCTAFFRPAALT